MAGVRRPFRDFLPQRSASGMAATQRVLAMDQRAMRVSLIGLRRDSRLA
jgi:hypothetical protein